MKLNAILIIAFACFIQTIKAADLLVEEFGLSPAYSSISAAISAASDGDRIFIRNRAGNIPWVEELTINKSLELLPFDNDTFFFYQGNVAITAASNRTVTIIGMNNSSGSITGSTGSLSARTKINILGSFLDAGSINMNFNGLKATIAHTQVTDGTITIRNGGVYGCEVINTTISTSISVISEVGAVAETVYIIGNKITASNTSTSVTAINWSSNTHFFDIRNNLVYSGSRGIQISNTISIASEINKIYNNTVSITGNTSNTQYGILVNSTTTGAILEVMNNLIHRSNSNTGVVGIFGGSSNAQVNAYYNYVHSVISTSNRVSGSFTVNTNNDSGVISLNANGNTTSGGIDAGNPSNVYFDLDLTRNDCGAYGGSFSLANYRPLHFGSSRVFFVKYPFNIRQGTTLSIEADGYDR